jgi:hypothetical protein
MPPSTSRPDRRSDPATRRRWQERLDRFPRSGLTVPAFCEREGVSNAALHAWRRRLRHDPPPPAGALNALDPLFFPQLAYQVATLRQIN